MSDTADRFDLPRGAIVTGALFAYVSVGVVIGIALRDPSLTTTLLATPLTWGVVAAFTALATLTYAVGRRVGLGTGP